MGCRAEEPQASPWFVGAALGVARTALRFDGDPEVAIAQTGLTASAGYRWSATTTLRVAVGAVLDGALEQNDRTYEIAPGPLAAVSVARQWQRGAWFATGTISLGASWATTGERGATDVRSRADLIAADLRVGAMAGRTIGPVSPYVAARAFGGPVFWTLDDRRVTGTDIHKYQLGAGLSLAAGRGLDVTLDVALLGERAAALGVSIAR